MRGSSMDIYVGNLPYEVTDAELQAHFEKFGKVTSSRVVMDKATGRAKGFGFVEMSNDAEAQAAITALNGKDCGGYTVKVNEAKGKG